MHWLCGCIIMYRCVSKWTSMNDSTCQPIQEGSFSVPCVKHPCARASRRMAGQVGTRSVEWACHPESRPEQKSGDWRLSMASDSPKDGAKTRWGHKPPQLLQFQVIWKIFVVIQMVGLGSKKTNMKWLTWDHPTSYTQSWAPLPCSSPTDWSTGTSCRPQAVGTLDHQLSGSQHAIRSHGDSKKRIFYHQDSRCSKNVTIDHMQLNTYNIL